MVIVRFRGGLGNQMFQCAFCEYLKRYNVEVYADLTEYTCVDCHNGYELEKIFGIELKKADIKSILKVADYIPVQVRGRIGFQLNKFFHILENEKTKKKGKKHTHIFQHEFDNMTENEKISLFKNNQDLYFDGYWDKKNYYNSVDYNRIFKFDKKQILKYQKMIPSENSCAVHIRKGDYINTDFDVIGIEYYEKAMKYMKSKNEGIVFYIFSDDIVAAKQMLGENEIYRYIETDDDSNSGIDMLRMSLCENNIIANSTYSFWAAKLNENTNKLVVAPKRYAKGREKCLADDDWILI